MKDPVGKFSDKTRRRRRHLLLLVVQQRERERESGPKGEESPRRWMKR